MGVKIVKASIIIFCTGGAQMGNSLGKNIKQLRKELKITQEQLATFTGVSTRTIEDYEQGITKDPSSHVLFSLAGYFKVDPLKLLTGGIEMASNNLYEEAIIEELNQIRDVNVIKSIHDEKYNGVALARLGISDDLIDKVKDNWSVLYKPNPNSKKPRSWYRHYIVETIEKYVQNRDTFRKKYELENGMDILQSKMKIEY